MSGKKHTIEQIDVEVRGEKQDVERSGGDKGYDDAALNKPHSISSEERRLIKKLDWRILPIACAMYLFACEDFSDCIHVLKLLTRMSVTDLDRSNLGNARLQGLPDDVLGGDPTGILYDWVNSMFFFPYVRFNLKSFHTSSELVLPDSTPGPGNNYNETLSSQNMARSRCSRMEHVFYSNGI